MSNNLYLVTGAAGFLGSNVCRQLLDRGDQVRALVLPNDPAIKYVPEEVEVIKGDLCDAASLEPFFAVKDGVTTICIHVASMVTVNPDFSQKLVDVNVGGTKNIIEKCLEHPECKKMVYVSSTGAIPELPKGQNISETTGTLIKIINGEMPIGMQGSFNLCDVRDLAFGCIAAADKGRKGECYILGNEEVTLKELCQLLQKDLGCKGIKFYLPLGLAKKLAAQMEKQAAKKGTGLYDPQLCRDIARYCSVVENNRKSEISCVVPTQSMCYDEPVSQRGEKRL